MLKTRCDDDVTVDSLKVRFSTPTRTYQGVSGRCLCCYVRPLLSLYGIIYVTWYTRLLPKATRVRFRQPSVYQVIGLPNTYQTRPVRPPKTKLNIKHHCSV